MKKIKYDAIAGFSVFLLALPLCLGIALASDFPPTAGILTAVVGGLVASWFGGAALSIKGPAAGLIAILLAAVQDLGNGDLVLGYKLTLAVGVIAALIQILLGITKRAVIAEVIPPPVIHGMLAAIGVIIIANQSYVMLGISPDSGRAPLLLLAKLPAKIIDANPVIMGIGLLALSITFLWLFLRRISYIPSSIIVLIVAVMLSLFFNLPDPHTYSFLNHSYSLGPEFLIQLPSDLMNAFTFPDFSMIASWTSFKYIILLSLVGSIESLLTVCAVDRIKPQEKPSNLNQDLLAIGIGNLVSSLIGGLPMISEVVRSKANIDYGARSSFANFFHGLFMLLAVLVIPSIINLIPLAALAGLLVFIGWRLTSPREFIHVYQIGKDQFILFLATFIITLLTDLLVGVACGIFLKIGLLLLRGNKINEIFNPLITIKKKGKTTYIEVEGPLTFASYLKFKNAILKSQEESQHIVIDFDAVTYIDHTVLIKLQQLEKELTDVKLVIEENQQLVHFYNNPLSSKRKLG